jgi:hypothetical protein
LSKTNYESYVIQVSEWRVHCHNPADSTSASHAMGPQAMQCKNKQPKTQQVSPGLLALAAAALFLLEPHSVHQRVAAAQAHVRQAAQSEA